MAISCFFVLIHVKLNIGIAFSDLEIV